MKNYVLKVWMLTVLCVLGASTSTAQKMIRVSGIVYNSADDKKEPFSDVAVNVYAAKTLSEGKDIVKALNQNDTEKLQFIDKESITTTDEQGYYEILVPDNGALIFKAGLTNAVLEKVDRRMKINIGIDGGIRLAGVTVTGIRTELSPEPKAPRIIGNQFMPYNTFELPSHLANSYSRMIIQPYVVDCETDDTIAYAKPLVYDGKEYALTQNRKKGYDMKRDPLLPYIAKDKYLSTQPMTIEWADTLTVPDPNKNYSCFATVSIEDYRAYAEKTYKISTCEAKRPMRFLQYDLSYLEMNPKDYKERPQIEKRNTSDKIMLNFEINSDKLVSSAENRQNIQLLRDKLKNIVASPGAILKEFHVVGLASPDGPYYKNQALATQRVKRIEEEIVSILPKYTLDRVYRNPSARVAPWSEVVNLLERDGKQEEARQVRDIISKTDNIGRQGAMLKKLSFYPTVIASYLEELRSVHYNCLYEIYREPNDEEIMEAFQKNGINGDYTRYEYWRLFQLIKDKETLKAIYRKAYERSKEDNPKAPWVLPANNLATLYLSQDSVDTSLLEPLIDRSVYVCDYKKEINESLTRIINPKEVVSNQLCMYIKKGDFNNASVLAKILPDDKQYDLLKAYAWAMGGYFKGGNTPEEKERAKKTFETIKNSSTQNAAVMYMALETKQGDEQAAKYVESMPQEEALTWYLKATLSARKGESEFNNTAALLAESFKRDKKFISTARNDGEFNEDLIDTALNMCNY